VAGRSVDQAREAGIEAYCTLIENAPDSLRGFGVITAIDVVEHVSDPRGFLTEIRARLRPGGVAYLETPNIYSAVYRLGRLLCHWTGARPVSIWERLFPIQHVQYFSQRGFALLVKGSGLELVKLDTRRLPWADVAVSPFLRSGVALLQQLDRLTRQQVLLCAMVRRPPGDA